MRYVVNIYRPQTIEHNKEICEYVDTVNLVPLHNDDGYRVNRITGSSLYNFNYRQYQRNEFPVIGGGKYMFWFSDKSDAYNFIEAMDSHAVKPEDYPPERREVYDSWFTKVRDSE